ncbi:MAG TPA: MBL fold metallo-hydrolase [Syntrophales bacterium]|jgi:glyoxylase-like metal-dependent hydrolase (beta-lactamase superfamily II)|nr:MBL fold metallo-hydrolase [Syntrophales bacterium]HOU78675.1 MBL fold metallo-hydrolase [Syntrophales bacterium]HPC33008.1 MBL fold metallo-hydrolase [Syntrophales bacterium]HQG34372.1 MBL fold metallo-hydrolase [Syntrophales bacterium]HQI36213.1 MBL fold metallo-hydrolase [Syntrophales bacterium]
MEKIADDLYMLTLPMPFRLGHVHAFLLVGDDRITMFDTGLNTPETLLHLEGSLRGIGREIGDIERIMISHYHIDHCGLAGRIQDVSGAAVCMSERSRPFILMRNEEEYRFVEEIKAFSRSHGLPEKAVDYITGLLQTFKKAGSSFTINEFITAEQVEILGGKEVCILPTPGHTHDHLSFYFPGERLLLSGDHVLPEITPNLSPNMFARDFRPLQSFLASLSRVEDLPAAMVYPAHGRPFTDLRGRIAAIRSHHDIRKGLTLKAVQGGPKNAFAVSRDIFGTELNEFDQFLALNETYVHLQELTHEGLIGERRADGAITYHA